MEGDFKDLWANYPRKEARKAALASYTARRREGVTHASLITAVSNYGIRVTRDGTERQYVLMGSTFFGSNERWRDYLEAPPPETKKGDKRVRTLPDGTTQRFYEGTGWA